MNKDKTIRQGPVPESFRPLFWEYDFDALSWEEDLDLITGKVLGSGQWADIQLLRTLRGDQVLRRWIIRHSGGSLSPPRLRFWELILDLPPGQVDRWLSAKSRKVWDGRAAS